jgi:hypothetical protein
MGRGYGPIWAVYSDSRSMILLHIHSDPLTYIQLTALLIQRHVNSTDTAQRRQPVEAWEDAKASPGPSTHLGLHHHL